MDIAERVLSDSLVTTARSLIGKVRGLATIPIITNLLGADSYGIWATTIAFVAMLETVAGMHLHGALIRYESDDGPTQTYVDVLALTAVFGAVVAGAAFVGGTVLDLGGFLGPVSTDEQFLVAAASLLVFSNTVFLTNRNLPRAHNRVKLYEGINALKQLCEAVALVAVFLTGGGVVEGVLVLLAVSVVGNAGVMAVVSRRATLPRPDPGNFRRYLAFGLPMVPKELFGSLLTHVDKVLVLYFVSPAAAGVYAVAYGVATTFRMFTDVLNPTLYPSVTAAWDDGDRDELGDLYRGIFRYYSILAVPAFVGVTLLADPVLVLISTERIAREGAVLLPLLTIGFFIRGYENPLTYILAATERTTVIGAAVVAAAVGNVALNVALIPRIGLYGAVASTLASHAIIVAVVYATATSELAIQFPVEAFGKAAVASGVMGAVLLALPFEFSPAVQVLVYPVVGATTYFAAMFALDGVSTDDLSYLRGMLPAPVGVEN